jgi:hypothetical protein
MHEGQTTLAKLIVALQTGGGGEGIKLSDEERHQWAKQDVRGCISIAHRLAGDLKTFVRLGVDDDGQLKHPEVEVPAIVKAGSLRKSATRKVMELFGSSKSLASTGSEAARSSSPGTATSKGKDLQASKGKDLGRFGKSKVKNHLLAGHRSPMRSADEMAAEAEEKRKAAKMTSFVAQSAPRLRMVGGPQGDIKSYILYQAEATPAGPPKPPPNPQRHIPEILTPSQSMTNDNQQSWGHVWQRLNHVSGAKDRQALGENIQSYYQDATWRFAHDVPLLDKAHSRLALHANVSRHVSALQTEKQKIVYRFAAHLPVDGSGEKAK